MRYPLKKTFSVYLTIRYKFFSRTVRLEIPQATIGDIAEFSSLSDLQKYNWAITKARNWGAGTSANRLVMDMGEGFFTILSDTFFKKNDIEKLPESVVILATKEGIYDYDMPDSVIFSTISGEYAIPPRDLLEYTMDELTYLMQALQYKNLNEAQKKELQRLKLRDVISSQKKSIDSSIEKLDNYFANQQL